MYSYDERLQAVSLYIKLGKRSKATIRLVASMQSTLCVDRKMRAMPVPT
jgi:hypothetical protein